MMAVRCVGKEGFALTVIAAAVINTWWSYFLAFILMTRGHVCLNILAHESAHRLLFTNRRANDWVGRLLAYPTYLAMLAYRRVHFAHHRDEMGPEEPDTALYAGYPIPRDSWRRKLTRDGTGISFIRPADAGPGPRQRFPDFSLNSNGRYLESSLACVPGPGLPRGPDPPDPA